MSKNRNGKGMEPKKGYVYNDKIRENYDLIFPPKKSSKEWNEIHEFFILDFDGWDRQNFEQSWTEKITEQEFFKRLLGSTYRMDKDSIAKITELWYK